MDVWETLNGIYEPLWRRTVALNKRLKEAGYSCKWDYCAFHSSIREEEYRMEYFPIPVITAEGICDIGIELDSVFIDAHLSRAQALEFDWAAVPWPFEVYGTENFLARVCLRRSCAPSLSRAGRRRSASLSPFPGTAETGRSWKSPPPARSGTPM